MTQEERELLTQDIQRGLELGELNLHELGNKYNVDHKTIAYWKKKIVAKLGGNKKSDEAPSKAD